MKKIYFTPKTDINEYLKNSFANEIFEDLTENEWQGIFDPLEFFNLLYEQSEILNANKEKPLSVVNHLLGLKLEKKNLYYLLDKLIGVSYIHYYPHDAQLRKCIESIIMEWSKLTAELFPKSESDHQPEIVNKYDFQIIKQQIETLPTVKDKIVLLIKIKTDFLQNKDDWDLDMGTPFDRKCELEIKMLNEILKLETATITPNAKPVFLLSDKKGAKIDLIRILNALYEIRLFKKADGQIPTKQEFFETMGGYFNVDLSKYHTNLSQALLNQPLEVNLKVFEDMMEVIKNAHHQTKPK